MPIPTNPMNVLPCLDSTEMAKARRHELDISHIMAAELGATAVDHARRGFYINSEGIVVDWSQQVKTAFTKKLSIPPGFSINL